MIVRYRLREIGVKPRKWIRINGGGVAIIILIRIWATRGERPSVFNQYEIFYRTVLTHRAGPGPGAKEDSVPATAILYYAYRHNTCVILGTSRSLYFLGLLLGDLSQRLRILNFVGVGSMIWC
ncbi:hypothetical protein L6164_020686 [Bauhinia variegata]|uniref:Uncharacterized protein n=1 Tax=Bauhinia variegata TaxID=167791 RepID=A0ACB9N0U4_BAUVA|nr:hypothetical protein L6164_020686 [Bauhinia variegata]